MACTNIVDLAEWHIHQLLPEGCFSLGTVLPPRTNVLPMCREGAFPGGSVVKNPPAMPKIGVQSLGWEDPLEKEMAAHSSILAWEIPKTEELGPLTQCLSQASVKVSERLQSPEDLTTEEPSSQLTCMVVSRIQGLASCWSEGCQRQIGACQGHLPSASVGIESCSC